MQTQTLNKQLKNSLGLPQLPADLLTAYKLSDLTELNTFENDDIEVIGAININLLNKLAQNDNSEWQIGIDEAGRGPLLGDVVVSAVLLPNNLSGEIEHINLENTQLALLNDSKKLTEKKRDALFEIIPNEAVAYITVSISATVIDTINILQASLLGMRLAGNYLLANVIKQMQLSGITQYPQVAFLYDGNKLPILNHQFYTKLGFDITNIKHEAVIKGDGKYSSIAAASVLAKVTRDSQMYELANKYPDYGIEKHKGYPTKVHFEMLKTKGVLPEHRMSFAPVKRVLASHV